MKHSFEKPRALAAAAAALAATPALAQYDPFNGEFGKSDLTDIRVISWNVEDGIVSTANKSDGLNSWSALVRIVAALQPDVLILQEAGDRGGNGTGSGVDSVAQLEGAIEDFIEGGPGVGIFVQQFAPSYDLPHRFVSTVSDGFNRNVILSRFPFDDINIDGVSQVSTFTILPGPDGRSGDPEPRGFQFAEIDLPDDTYTGNLVIGNGHLKAFGEPSDIARRAATAERVATYIYDFYSGKGTGVPDPDNRVDGPDPVLVLPTGTPVIWGGDMNEDEGTNGRNGPVAIMTENFFGVNDGTDIDQTDSAVANALDPFTGSDNTRGGSTLDYLMHQDSQIIGVRRAFIFNSSTAGPSRLPFPVTGFPQFPQTASNFAADHLPVVVDYQLPLGNIGNNTPPTINSAQALPSTFVAGDDLTVTVDSTDPDGSVILLEVFDDTNGNGTLETGTDANLGTFPVSTNPTVGVIDTGATGIGSGPRTLIFRVTDNGLARVTATTQVTVLAPPVLSGFLVTPGSFSVGDTISLSVNAVDDGMIAAVDFYLDDGDNQFDAMTDHFLVSGPAQSPSSVNFDTTGAPFVSGANRLFAVVTDDDGLSSSVSFTASVNLPPEVMLTLTPSTIAPDGAATLDIDAVDAEDGQLGCIVFLDNGDGIPTLGIDTIIQIVPVTPATVNVDAQSLGLPLGNSLILVDVTDVDGGQTVGEATITVGNGCNAADITTPFGTLDLSDVQAFLIGFGNMDPIADIAGGNPGPDGLFDLTDVQTFLIDFGAGCP